MNNKKWILSLLMISTVSCTPNKDLASSAEKDSVTSTKLRTFEQSGTVGGGGGKTVVCRDSNAEVISVELLDLFEAKNIYGLAINESTEPVETQVDKLLFALEGIDPNYSEYKSSGIRTPLVEEYDNIQRNIYWVKNAHLILTDDSYEKIVPNGCAVEQLINYTAQGEVLIDHNLWSKMTSTNQAAAFAHETLYAFLRLNYGENNSLNTRRAVGLATSGHKFESFLAKATSPNILHCLSQGDVFAKAVAYEENNQVKFAVLHSYQRVFLGLTEGVVLKDFNSLEDFRDNYTTRPWQALVNPKVSFGSSPRIWAYNNFGQLEINDQTINSPNARMHCDWVSKP